MQRFTRLSGAVALTAADPPRVVQGDAVERLADAVALVPDGAHAVVFHSWALTYLERSRRADFEAEVARLGQERDLTWVSAEHPGCMASIPVPEVMPEGITPTLVARQRWRGGRTIDPVPEALAIVHPHVAQMWWTAEPS
jgi:hypothetical protein